MNREEQLKNLQAYFNLMSMNGGMRIFQTAQQLGVFKVLQGDPRSAADVAEACELKETPTRLLLDGLCGLDVLTEQDGVYALAPVMQLLVGDYQSLSNRYWDYLPEFLNTGEPMAGMDQPEQSEQHYQAQVTALDWMMQPSAELAANLLKLSGEDEIQILDLGAGSAVWSLALARRFAKANVTAVDWPAVLKIAQANAEQSGLTDRFSVLPGNFHEVEFEQEKYDVVIVGNVTHLETEAGNLALFKKVFRTLKPGGQVVVFDVFGDQEPGRLQSALYALGLGLRTVQGQVFSVDALTKFLQESGLKNVNLMPLEITPFTMGMMTAEK